MENVDRVSHLAMRNRKLDGENQLKNTTILDRCDKKGALIWQKKLE